ncbi:MAG: hypothetical protein OXE95_08470 [Chloroflexi bacterium]|nr:hypothetical protein [Chloroflexota bacterium]MCY4247592.1 hypothetical protein [Chloroflexota bacterium]
MKFIRSKRMPQITLGGWLLIVAGVFVALFGLLLDRIFQSSNPGIRMPQLLIAALGAALALVGVASRGRLPVAGLRANLGKIILITLVTLVMVEAALIVTGYSTYYPVDLPKTNRKIVDWFGCDAAMGCRFQYEAARDACEAGELRDMFCIFNTQGFADTDEFVASADLFQRNRTLVLGDSFTQGDGADVGFSYVATIEKTLPEIALWNLGINRSGTNQALASFRGIAPIMQPQLTILGFTVGNDFRDNRLTIEKAFALNKDNRPGADSWPLELEGRWGGLYEVEPLTLLVYSPTNISPPPNELERLTGLTRLGSILLRSLDALSPLFDGIKWNEQVAVTRGLLQQLQAAIAAMDSQMLVLIILSKEDFPTKTEKYTTAIGLMRELAIPYLEVFDRLQGLADYEVHGTHWNNSGHGKVGKLLSECIEDFFAAGSLSACDHVVRP